MSNIEKESETEKNDKLKSEIIKNKLKEKSKQSQLEHCIKREEMKNSDLNNKLKKNCGTFFTKFLL